MPPMNREEHEEILNKLNDPELSATERSDMLGKLRADYTEVHSDFSELEKKNQDYKELNEDLTHANSKMFRDLGFHNSEDETERQMKQKTEEQEFSENITISDLEKQF